MPVKEATEPTGPSELKTACARKSTGSSSCRQQDLGHLPSVCRSGAFGRGRVVKEGQGPVAFADMGRYENEGGHMHMHKQSPKPAKQPFS